MTTPPSEFAEMIEHLDTLRARYPGRATPGYLKALARQVYVLEASGRTHFGGPHVLAWWLAERARRGWTHLQLTSYMAQLWAERMPHEQQRPQDPPA